MLYNKQMDIAFIDGENTKGRIRDVFAKYKLPLPSWDSYDFKGLFDEAFKLYPVTERRFYRALPKRHPDLVQESALACVIEQPESTRPSVLILFPAK